MTPKEKAIELFSKFYNGTDLDTLYESRNIAKQCALICIEEIIENEATYDYSINDYDYWLEVKKETELL